MKHRIKNFATLIIAVSMLLSLIPFYGTALDDEFAGLETLEEIPFEFELEPGDLPWEQLESAVLAASDIPACISPALAEERGHVNRLYLQEPDDYTVMFQNRDGSKTIYVFSYPVKSTGMSMNTAAAIQVNGSAISFSSGNIITSRIGVDIKDYSIGYCEIQTFYGGMLTADGVNITEDARGWARGGSSASNLVYNMSGAAAAEYNMNISATANATLVPGITITPNAPLPGGGITVMAISYSTLAGFMSFKNVATNQYLTLTSSSSPSLTMSNSIINPYSRWMVYYDAEWGYIFANQSDIANTYIGKMSSQSNTLSIGSKDTITYLWGVTIVSSANSTVTIADNNHAISSNGTLVTKSWSLSNAPTSCQWTIVNHQPSTFALDINPNSPVLTVPAGTNFYLDYNIEPSNANLFDIGLYYADTNTEVTHDTETEEDDIAYYVNMPGMYSVYYKDSVTGVTSDYFALVVVNLMPESDNNLTYTISPQNFPGQYMTMTANTKIEGTTTVYQAESNAISFATIPTNSFDLWDNISKTFVIEMNSGGYNISATLATLQYLDVPDGTTIDTISSYNPNYDIDYNLTKLSEQNNALNISGTLISTKDHNADGSILGLYPITVANAEDNVKYYIIICGASQDGVLALKYDASSGCTVSLYNSSDSFVWKFSQVGVNAPLIKQTTDFWCGYTTALQALYGKNCNVSSFGNTLHQQIEYIAVASGHPNEMAYTFSLDEDINDELPSFGQNYKNEDGVLPSYDNAKQKIRDSLNSGWTPFFLTHTAGVPYRRTGNGAHFICIIGYDSQSDCVIISNCHFSNQVFGIYTIPYQQFYQALSCLYWQE